MTYRILLIMTAVMALVCGIAFVGCGPALLPYFGVGSISIPEHEVYIWRKTVGFTNLFGALLVGVGAFAWLMRNLDRPEDQRRISAAFFVGSSLLLIIAFNLQRALPTGTGWIAIYTILFLAINYGYLIFVEYWGLSFKSPVTSQPPEKLREQWATQLSEAAAQQERNRLARDLHDSIKQQIFSINVSAAAAQERWTSDAPGARLALEDVRNSAREAMAEMEAMLQHLRPAPLENIGLVEALRRQSEALQYRTGAAVTSEFGDLPENETLLPGTQEAIFRIAQEGLNNIARHARAKNVHLRLYQQCERENPMLWLMIKDDGMGYDTTRSSSGMGLGNISARAAEIGGRLHIESRPSHGTSLTVQIPLVSPDVSKIKRQQYFSAAYRIAFALLIGILMRYRIDYLVLLLLIIAPLVPITLINERKEKRAIEKLGSMRNLQLKISLELTRYKYQTLIVIYNIYAFWGMKTHSESYYSQSSRYFIIFLLIAVVGGVMSYLIFRIHQTMRELQAKLSHREFQQSIEQMWKQTMITLIATIPPIVILALWTNELRPFGYILSSFLYLGYVAWWHSRNVDERSQITEGA